MNKIKIVLIKYKNGVEDDCEGVVIEDTPANRKKFLKKKLSEFKINWDEEADDFVNQKINSVDFYEDNFSDNGFYYTFYITTYEKELEILKNQIRILKMEFGIK